MEVIMKDVDSFINILKYQSKTGILQIENYTTELFVFILNYLKYKKNPILKKILENFGFENNVDYECLEINTQTRSLDYDDLVIFDILMTYKKCKKIVIEVKVDSGLRYYRNGQNQIEYYGDKKGIDNVYLLSKKMIKIENPEKRILWSMIYRIISPVKEEDFVIANFVKYLEVNGMCSNKLNSGILDGLLAINNFYDLDRLLSEAWPEDFDNSYSIGSLGISIKEKYCGSYIKKGDKNIIWIGQGGEDGGYLLTQILDKYIKDGLESEGKDEWFLGALDLNEIVNYDTVEEQKNAINEWFWGLLERYKKIEEKYLKTKNGT
jgi:hypothetical protein